MQQNLLYSHLQQQFADRCCYWMQRGRSRCRGPELTLITDGMDQAKFGVPRASVLKAKQFDSMNKPRLHCAACILHGWGLNFYISEPNLCKDSNTSIEILSHCLTDVRDAGFQLSSSKVCIQADNTCREVKNGITMRWLSALISDNIIKEAQMTFLRSGHSHEDVDQVFGHCADWVRRKLPVALTSEDFVRSINEFLKQLDRPHDPSRHCYKLDQTRDWFLGDMKTCVSIM